MTRQTARKSTSVRSNPVQMQMAKLLTTKKNSPDPANISLTQQLAINEANIIASRSGGAPVTTLPYGGRGKFISISDQNQQVKTRPRREPATDARRTSPNVLSDIRRLQHETDLLIPRAAFHRVVREVALKVGGSDDLKFQTAALLALQESAEAYLVRLMEDSYQCTLHAKRVTLFIQDVHLCKRLRRACSQ